MTAWVVDCFRVITPVEFHLQNYPSRALARYLPLAELTPFFYFQNLNQINILSIMANWFTRLFGKKTSDFVKEEGRYYFYNDKCSFLLPKEEIKNVTVEKGGRKFTLFTDSMAMVILEIRDGMPVFPMQVQSKQITVGGLPCLAAAVGPLAALAGGYNQYFINCRKFVVQVSFTIADEGAMRFLNSFKLHK